jgi:hypothetical protein
MKRSKGRPKGKKYPQPRTTEGFDTAIYGKIGVSEAMGIIRDCPYPTIEFIKKVPPKHRGQGDKRFLKWAPKLEASWALRIGPIIGQKIASGHGEFFRQLTNAVEEFSNIRGPIESPRRYLAITCKFFCEATGVRFTQKALRDYYNRHNPGEKIDSSTLSKQFKWAQSAEVSNEDLIQELGPPRRRLHQRPETALL